MLLDAMECYRGYLVTVGESLGGFLMQVEFLKLEPQVEDSWRETGSKGCSDIWEGQLDMKDVTITTLRHARHEFWQKI